MSQLLRCGHLTPNTPTPTPKVYRWSAAAGHLALIHLDHPPTLIAPRTAFVTPPNIARCLGAWGAKDEWSLLSLSHLSLSLTPSRTPTPLIPCPPYPIECGILGGKQEI